MGNQKIIHDPLHGSISVDGTFLKLLNRPELQRLRSVKQLGMSYMVFPGANHTRFEHSLGVYHLAGRMCSSLNLEQEDSDVVRAAALLHDVCHPPFSHTLEQNMESATGLDHMELSKKLIFGDVPLYYGGGAEESIAELLESEGISAVDVADLIINPTSEYDVLDMFTSDQDGQSFLNTRDYLHQIIHGPVDADQIDYLMRDSHYTGVKHGAVDIERILSQLKICHNRIVLSKGGIAAAEGLMVSRLLMYSSVYYHKTIKIVESMLRRAVELSDIDASKLYLMNDYDLMSELMASEGKPRDLARSILNRDLYKKSVMIYSVDADDDLRMSLSRYSSVNGRKRLENEIASTAGMDPEDVIVDISSKSTLLSKVKIGKTDVSILDGDKVKSITKYSSIAKAVQSRSAIEWVLMVSSPEEKRESVRDAVLRILSLDDSDRS